MNKIDLKKLINKAISNEGFLSMPSFLMNDILTSIVDCITEPNTDLPDNSTDNPNIDSPSVDVPEGDPIIGTYTQRWGIKALQTYGPDNWGTDAAITAFEGEKLCISPVFGSTGFNTDVVLEKVDYNLYRLDGGIHNLLGTTSPVYFKVENNIYIEEYNMTVSGTILKAYADAECTSSYIQLNNGNYITDYVLIKNA